MSDSPPQYTKKDFMTDQLVRWCPGCGDYSVLAQMQATFAELGIPRENFAVVSGIGCNGRFPYYMNTFGFHTIHGRAPAIATGLKTTRPELSVWVITGDGDSLSIGGNHLIHVLRRNVDLNIVMFDNRIYGLTKGQYSPTSEVGKKTKSTPMGSIDNPFNPLAVTLGAGATFVAQSVDVFAKHLRGTFHEAHAHSGTSFVHVFQNCNIFNDKAFASFTDRKVRDERVLYLEHGKPMIWGKESRKGFVLNGLSLDIVDVGGEDGVSEDRILCHDETNLMLATLLAHLRPEDGYPVPVGVIRRVAAPTYDAMFNDQVSAARKKLGDGDLHALMNGSETWTV